MSYTIDKAEVLRYLGIRGEGAPHETERLIDECIAHLCSIVRRKYTYQIFSLSCTDEIYLAKCNLTLIGTTARKNLKGCHSCAILAATLGHEADDLIRRTQITDMARALVYDACATDLIEKVCDKAQAEIAERASKDSSFITDRFSAGYGDLPIELQADLCSILDTNKKIGMVSTKEFLLLPTKSVTAFIGITNDNKTISGKVCKSCCENCSMKGKCNYAK